jgi:putative oxidoreductase
MNMNSAVQVTYFLLRVMAGLLFLQFGGLILFGWFGGMPDHPGPPSIMSQTGIGGLLEFFGGIAIVLGLGTRPVAFILSGMMAVAYWQFHAPHGGWPIQNQGVPAVLFCFLFLHMAARGGSTGASTRSYGADVRAVDKADRKCRLFLRGRRARDDS